MLLNIKLAFLLFFMSYRRKVRSSHSIYHPGISLSHEPTYNQKKGMILTRSTNLPQPVQKVITAKSLRDDAKRAVKSGYVKFSRVTLDFSVDHVNNEWSIDEATVRELLAEKLGPGINIIAANVNQFSFSSNGLVSVWPDINYTISIDDNAAASVTTTHSSSSTGFSSMYTAVFNNPNYVPFASQISYSLVCPRFETYTSSQFGYARVVYDGYGLIQSVKEKLDSLHRKGFTEIPFCSFGGIYPCSIDTVLTFNASSLSESLSITLQLSCDVYYIK